MRILVTGGAGFIGSHFVRHELSAHEDAEVVTLDALTYAGNLENLADLEGHPRHRFVRGDMARSEDLRAVFGANAFDAVVNFAAESHVDRSLHLGAQPFVRTNTLGVQVLLDEVRSRGGLRFLQVSTDEVYGSLGPEGRFTEETPLAPNNPYAASKAGADLLVRAAHRSFGLDAVITRCSNNFGPFQFPEKLIPLMIGNALADQPLPVYGDGLQVRDWLYVEDHCRALDAVLRRGRTGAVYNIGGNNEAANIEVVQAILKYLGKPDRLIRHVTDRPGHDRRYAMDASLLRNELGWAPSLSFTEALERTIDWYRTHTAWLDHVRSGAYRTYYQRLYGGAEAARP